jgi:hypothetical protein
MKMKILVTPTSFKSKTNEKAREQLQNFADEIVYNDFGRPLSSSELKEIDKNGIAVINSWGPGTYEKYSIHQIEPIVALMGADAKRVMYLGDNKYSSTEAGVTIPMHRNFRLAAAFSIISRRIRTRKERGS